MFYARHTIVIAPRTLSSSAFSVYNIMLLQRMCACKIICVIYIYIVTIVRIPSNTSKSLNYRNTPLSIGIYW